MAYNNDPFVVTSKIGGDPPLFDRSKLDDGVFGDVVIRWSPNATDH